jgi:hypothetical protein
MRPTTAREPATSAWTCTRRAAPCRASARATAEIAPAARARARRTPSSRRRACVLPRDANGIIRVGKSFTAPVIARRAVRRHRRLRPDDPVSRTGFAITRRATRPSTVRYGVPSIASPRDCVGGPRRRMVDIYEETVLNNPQCGTNGRCVKTVCPGATRACEKPWTCNRAQCESNGLEAAGSDCSGEYACEKYSCDANGDCADENRTRSGSASCRPPANECDVRDFCGDQTTSRATAATTSRTTRPAART